MRKTQKDEQLDLTFHALADSTRRNILLRLSKEDLSIKALAEEYKMTLAAVSKHIRVLAAAKLLKTTKEGRVHRCEMTPEPLAEISEVIAAYQKFWGDQLSALEDFLTQTTEGK